jgi:hypothetical protein
MEALGPLPVLVDEVHRDLGYVEEPLREPHHAVEALLRRGVQHAKRVECVQTRALDQLVPCVL